MTLKKTLLFFALGFLILFLPSTTMANNDMDGFRGIKWGTEFDTVKHMMTYIETDPSYGGVIYYQRTNDPLEIGSAKLKSIEYGFWQGQLMCVYVQTDRYSNYSGLRKSLSTKLGLGHQPNKYIEKYMWFAESYTAKLDYNRFSEEVVLCFFSREVSEKANQWKKQKASEGAGDF